MGSTSGMTEGIIMALLFVVLTGVVLAHFNTKYDQDFSVGLDTSGLDSFSSATQTAYDETTGEVSQTSDGLTLSSSYSMFKGLMSTAWSFINGSWINNLIINVLKLEGTGGQTIVLVLRILFLGLLLWSVIKLFFKVIP